MNERQELEISSPESLKAMMWQISDDIRESVNASEIPEKDHYLQSLRFLSEGLEQLLDLLAALQESEQQCASEKISKISNTGLELLTSMASLANELGLEQQCHQMNSISLLTAVWMGRAGAKLQLTRSMVQILSHIAGSNSDREILETLSQIVGELVAAIAPESVGEQEQQDWFTMNLCWLLITLRAQQTELIQAMLQQLSISLGDRLPALFESGLRQIAYGELDAPTRELIERFRQQMPGSVSVH